MNTYASEGKEKKSTTSYHRSNQDGAFQSEDTRSEAIQMQHIQELANSSLQSLEIFQLQAMADNFIIQRKPGDQERKNNSSRFKESWSEEEEAFVWIKGNQKFKRKNSDETSDKLPENLSTDEKEEVLNGTLTNFSFDSDSDSDVSDLKLETIDLIDSRQITQLNPKGDKIRTFLQDECNQSWHIATKELNKDSTTADSTKKDNRRNMLRKIWEYRQWHHNFILNKTQIALGGDRLTEWAAAGSTTLTSDIDVNLKGTDTEAAVQKFNKIFIDDGWDYEAGIVYDVNVYALDFMHKEATFGKGMVDKKSQGIIDVTKDIHGNVLTKKDTVKDKKIIDNTTSKTGIVAKEGARKGRAEGGFDGSNENIIEADKIDQDIWTHVKTRLYMSKSEWDLHATTIGLDPATKTKIEERFENYSKTLQDRMLEDSPSTTVEVEEGNAVLAVEALKSFSKKATANEQEMDEDILEAKSSNLMMASSNRIYEEKLVIINALRQILKGQVKQYDGILNSNRMPLTDPLQQELDLINLDIESNLQLLRNMLAEAALFSNEAYITDGAVNHAVVGTQVGMAVKLKNSESKNAVVENLADSLKEISRHGDTIGEAAFKSGKYLFRMADAALNMGFTELSIKEIYNSAVHISSTIKGNSDLSGEEQKTESAEAIQKIAGWGGVNKADDLKAKVKEVAQKIIIWYTEKDAAFSGQDSNAVGTNKPKKK